MSDLKRILMNRDGYTSEEADQEIEFAKQEVLEGSDPEEVLADFFGLEPDYVFDLLY